MTSLRPFFTFYGGKWRAAPRYPAPQHRTIVEPFAGSAGYSLRYADRRVILVDRDPIIAATWRYLIGVTSKEILSLPDIEVGQTVDDLNVCQEARLLIGWWLNPGCSSPCKRAGAWMRGGTHAHRVCFWGPLVRQRIAEQVPHIRHWRIFEDDYEDAPDIEATWFVDPPYRGAGKHYRVGHNVLNYEALGLWCYTRRGQVIVCEQESARWLPFRSFGACRSNKANSGRTTSAEAIWTNEAAP